jgi:hypothetical protein
MDLDDHIKNPNINHSSLCQEPSESNRVKCQCPWHINEDMTERKSKRVLQSLRDHGLSVGDFIWTISKAGLHHSCLSRDVEIEHEYKQLTNSPHLPAILSNLSDPAQPLFKDSVVGATTVTQEFAVITVRALIRKEMNRVVSVFKKDSRQEEWASMASRGVQVKWVIEEAMEAAPVLWGLLCWACSSPQQTQHHHPGKLYTVSHSIQRAVSKMHLRKCRLCYSSVA